MFPIPFALGVWLLAVLGVALGSFATVLVHRLPSGESISGRSRCPGCRKTLQWVDLVPVLSFLLLRGRCRRCHQFIALEYPILEISSALVLILPSMVSSSLTVLAVLQGLSLWVLLVVAVVDAKHQAVPDSLTLPLLVLAGFTAWNAPAFSVLAPLLGGGFFAAQWILSRGRWVGSADILVATGIGILLGTLPSTILAIIVAYISGSLFAVILLATRKATRTSRIAFIPFLALGALIALLWGAQILQFFRL